jgi:hypothetical protein
MPIVKLLSIIFPLYFTTKKYFEILHHYKIEVIDKRPEEGTRTVKKASGHQGATILQHY